MKDYLLLCLFPFILFCGTTTTKDSDPNQKEDSPKVQGLVKKLDSTIDDKRPLTLDYSKKLFNNQQYEKSIEVSKAIIQSKEEARNAEAHFWIGKSYFALGNFTDAFQFLTNAKSFNKDFQVGEREMLLAKIHFHSKDYGRGLRSLGEATKDKSFQKNQEFYEMAATGFKEIKLCKRSIQYIHEGLKLYPNSNQLKQVRSECK